MSGNIVKWGSWDDTEAKAEQEEAEKFSGGTPFFKFKPGKNLLRFLPPPLGKKSPMKRVMTHGINLPNGGFVSIACARLEAKQPCIICQRADQLRSSHNPADQDKAKDLFAKPRIYANAIDREHPEDGPQVVAFGKQIHEALLALRNDPDAGGDFTNPETGFDIVIERKGTGKNDTEYKVFAARKASPLGDLNWIEQQSNLDVFGKILTPEEIRAKVSPKAAEQEAARPANAKPVQGQRLPARTQATAPAAEVIDSTAAPAEATDDLPF